MNPTSEALMFTGDGNNGVELSASGNNQLIGNFIGTDKAATASLGNGTYGVEVYGGADDTAVGGLGTGEGNVIAHNGLNGVAVDSSVDVPILSNLISDNGTGLSDGILLSNGGNDSQQSPVLDKVVGGNVLSGSYDIPNPNSTFFLQVFRRTGTGQPELLFSGNVTTNAMGNFSVTLTQTVAVGDFLFATATVGSNTSEFDVLMV